LPDRVFDLFDEYAAAFARGERPRADEYLARAGEGAGELAGLLYGLVSAAPASAAPPSEVAAFELWLEPRSALSRRRGARGLTRDGVVDSLIERLGLDRSKREKVKRYYRALEAGLLDVSRVHRHVWDALAAAVEAPVEALLAPLQADPGLSRPAAEAMAKVAYRAPAAPAPPMVAGGARREEPQLDEIDRLFLGGG
jgi:hypothetical protein